MAYDDSGNVTCSYVRELISLKSITRPIIQEKTKDEPRMVNKTLLPPPKHPDQPSHPSIRFPRRMNDLHPEISTTSSLEEDSERGHEDGHCFSDQITEIISHPFLSDQVLVLFARPVYSSTRRIHC
jgi:hypothetical protein